MIFALNANPWNRFLLNPLGVESKRVDSIGIFFWKKNFWIPKKLFFQKVIKIEKNTDESDRYEKIEMIITRS